MGWPEHCVSTLGKSWVQTNALAWISCFEVKDNLDDIRRQRRSARVDVWRARCPMACTTLSSSTSPLVSKPIAATFLQVPVQHTHQSGRSGRVLFEAHHALQWNVSGSSLGK